MSTILALLLASQAQLMPPEEASAVGAWGACNGRRRAELASSPGSAEAVTDAVLSDCRQYEDQLRTLLSRRLGARDAAARVREVHANFRELGIASVNELRGGAPVTDDNFLWGRCVGSEARELAGSDGEPDAIARRAFDACLQYEGVVRARWVTSRGRETADSYMSMVREEMRRRVIEVIAAQRAPRSD